ncbi:heavy-metal-associated domain-containing protein [Nocardia stercoris]|uniref:Heavy-metal-associated domain-containing protein n=1 Tax=Nocardia stercoris TaxID=2483361 RepID=A0A3M2L162_9NOCA|nr:heavy-metal-associated domain-containing protein [Nocardia stercoris]
MNAGTRLALYGVGLAVAFGGAFGVAKAVVPADVVTAWTDRSSQMQGHENHDTGAATDTVQGVSSSADGLVLTPVQAPTATGTPGTLAYRIEDTSGAPLTSFTTTHDRDMHLIVVRSDGSNFRHVHPALDPRTGTWSLPWTWNQAGTYRVYADFTPGQGRGVTLSRTVEVAGDYRPVVPEPTRVSTIDGYTVTLRGEVAAGTASELTFSVERDGRPVTTLQPYLGAFGHLVALRQGDLAFLHVHPDGAEPGAGATGGPRISFATEVPTAGKYLLYLDFQVDGVVHTATFVLDAAPGTTHAPGTSHAPGEPAPAPAHAH